jgi:outer membrane lipoprotein-sorting protein
MSTRALATFLIVAALQAAAAGADPHPSKPAASLSADQIVERNIEARGGLDAWRKVQTMSWQGHISGPASQESRMAYVLEQKRPNKTRFDVRAMNQRSLRVFDGSHGWKVGSTPNGRPKVDPYTPSELKFAQDADGIDGLLIDYKAKGNKVMLDGIENVDGRSAYRLAVTRASGDRHHVWIDAQSFLDVKYDRTSIDQAGRSGTVTVYLRDFKSVDGLQIPGVIETGIAAAAPSSKMELEKILVNPPLEDQVFAKPSFSGKRGSVLVDTRSVADPQSTAGRPAATGRDPASAGR